MKPFTDTLREARKGVIADRLTDELAAVVKAVDATNKAGELTLKVTVKPDKHGGTQKTLSFDIKAKLPTHPTPEAVFWSNVDGDLLRADPDQGDMFVDTADARAGRA
ncbi:hypothetical protein [Asticcacaulis sp.]|uniref:hypothetical protein n=1 Tax=Asticcacaulis sp. TaxID=1872648 RepID=UPI003F7CAAC0